MKTRSIVTALAIALMFTCSGPASAQQAKCRAGKTKCIAKKAAGLLKCNQVSETPGKPTDPNDGGCVDKVVGKFDGGEDTTKGCFGKLEGKTPNDCPTLGDTGSAETSIDSCVATLVGAIDPASHTQSKCGVGKNKCVAKYLASLLKCTGKAQTPGQPTDPNTKDCVTKAQAKYTGGADSTKGCFAKLEAKTPNDCETPGNSGSVQTLVEACGMNLVNLTASTTTTVGPTTTSTAGATTTTTTGGTTTTTLGGGGTVAGALPSTAGRFTYNATPGLPGALAACHMSFGNGTHVCTLAELQNAASNGGLVGLKDTTNMTVTSFWAIDSAAPALQQCNDDTPGTGSGLNWEYGTAHTLSRGSKVDLTNATGILGSLVTGLQCNFSGNAWVACCQ